VDDVIQVSHLFSATKITKGISRRTRGC
jgi:hypothetical protein